MEVSSFCFKIPFFRNFLYPVQPFFHITLHTCTLNVDNRVKKPEKKNLCQKKQAIKNRVMDCIICSIYGSIQLHDIQIQYTKSI